MKRGSSLLLALCLLLTLTACGKTAPAADSAAFLLEEPRFGADGSAYADHVLLPAIYGNWVLDERVEHGADFSYYRSLTISEDGSCLVDGEEALWKIEDDLCTASSLQIGVYRQGQCIWGALFGAEFSGVYLLPTRGLYEPPMQAQYRNTDPAVLYSSHPVYPDLCGSYNAKIREGEEAAMMNLVIKEDGSCTIDGNPARWEFCLPLTNGHSRPYVLGITILVDGEETYYVQLLESGELTVFVPKTE